MTLRVITTHNKQDGCDPAARLLPTTVVQRDERPKLMVPYEIFSKTMVAWILSPPPMPLLPEEAVVMVCNRYPIAA